MNKGEIVWTVNAVYLPVIGHAFLTGRYAPTYQVVVAGSKAKNAGYATMTQGVSLSSFVSANIDNDNTRMIAGDVLTGTTIEENGFLSFGKNFHPKLPDRGLCPNRSVNHKNDSLTNLCLPPHSTALLRQ